MSSPPIKFDMEIFGDAPPKIVVQDHGVVLLKGEEGDKAFVVRKGAVEIRRAGRSLELLGPGCMVGEMELLDHQARGASAVAVGQTELIVIDREFFNRLIATRPDFAMNVMLVLVGRLRALASEEAA